MFKTWIEISRAAVKRNLATFRRLIGNKTKIFAVVKSNAYGHGLVVFSKLADELGVDPHTKRGALSAGASPRYGVGVDPHTKRGALSAGASPRYGVGVDGFCVDSVIEGVRLREEGIEKPILVLGPTFKNLLKSAAENDITITISSLDALRELKASKFHPEFHLKIDTGMHRQGFYVRDLRQVLNYLIANRLNYLVTGIYTHFASAKDINYPAFTEKQFAEFQKALAILEKAGLKNLVRHVAATGGTLVNKKYHLDAVRIGIGLYGLWPSTELGIQMEKIKLEPVLSWRALISEVKEVEAGDFVGYDLTERVSKKSKIAIIPIGYWHGYPRSLSGVGEVLVGGKRARVLGRVSMDMIVVDITGIAVKRGDSATLIGKQKSDEMSAYEVARRAGGASYYELLTRINPLIERIVR